MGENMGKNNKLGKQSIECTVYDCKHCNYKDDCCELEKIKVCDGKNKDSKESTMCDSYDKR